MNETKPAKIRRWFWFGLKSMCLAMLLAGAYFAGWRSAVWKAERDTQQAIGQALEDYEATMAGIDIVPELGMFTLTGPGKDIQERINRITEYQKFMKGETATPPVPAPSDQASSDFDDPNHSEDP